VTMTETRPEAHLGAAEGHEPAAGHARDLGGVTEWLTTGDHTKVGRLFALSSLLFGVGALATAALVALERIDPTSIDIFDRATDAEQVTHLSVWALMALCVLPLLAGLAIAVVPLQVGARSIAFPRAAAFSYWMWLVGSLLLIGSVLANGGPGGTALQDGGLYPNTFKFATQTKKAKRIGILQDQASAARQVELVEVRLGSGS